MKLRQRLKALRRATAGYGEAHMDGDSFLLGLGEGAWLSFLAAEVMTIAWRRLADVPLDDPRPWLFATARNLVLADSRRSSAGATADLPDEGMSAAPEVVELDPALRSALWSLSRLDRESIAPRRLGRPDAETSSTACWKITSSSRRSAHRRVGRRRLHPRCRSPSSPTMAG